MIIYTSNTLSEKKVKYGKLLHPHILFINCPVLRSPSYYDKIDHSSNVFYAS